MNEQMKKCPVCGREKPLSEFNKNRRNKDGRHDRCRKCSSEYNKKRYRENPERDKSNVRRYREENLDRVFETRIKMCAKNPSKKNAREAVNLAVQLGKIKRPSVCSGCGCSDREHRIEAHHHDYSKPLDVVWLCTVCHRAMDANKREQDGLPRYYRMRRVSMYRDGEKLCTFESISDAAKAVSRSSASIRQCLSGISKSSAGFQWKYEEERCRDSE